MSNLSMLLAGVALYMAALVLAYGIAVVGLVLLRVLRYKLRKP